MKNLVKFGIAGALALSGTMAAHASIVVPSSSGTTGDLVLFADVFNGSTLVKAYAGDTGIAVTTISGKSLSPLPNTFTDTNLTSLLSSAAGNTVVWAIEGGGNGSAHFSPPDIIASGDASLAHPFGGNVNGSTINLMQTGLNGEITNLNGLIGNGSNAAASITVNSAGTSMLSTSPTGDGPVTSNGTAFNPNLIGNDAHNWYGVTPNIPTTGLNTSAGLFALTATSTAGGAVGNVVEMYTAELTSAGLVISALSTGGGAVPIPAAVWLLGSGLLGLAGVARRKVGGAV
jgi:hypothetical protein